MRGGFIRNGDLVLGILLLGPVACCPQEPGGNPPSEVNAKWNRPLLFARQSKAGSAKEYMAVASGTRALFLKDRVTFQVPGSTFQMRFLGSNNNAQPQGEDQQAARVNYLVGGQQRDWLTDLPTYQTVAYHDIYPGIDVRFGFSGRRLKSEFVVAPGADPSRISFRYAGLGVPRIDERDAVFEMASGEFREEGPKVYQWKQGTNVRVPHASLFPPTASSVLNWGRSTMRFRS